MKHIDIIKSKDNYQPRNILDSMTKGEKGVVDYIKKELLARVGSIASFSTYIENPKNNDCIKRMDFIYKNTGLNWRYLLEKYPPTIEEIDIHLLLYVRYETTIISVDSQKELFLDMELITQYVIYSIYTNALVKAFKNCEGISNTIP